MRAGVIDIGSNSIKLIIGEAEKEDIKVLESLKSVVPIGKHAFFKGSISQETINQTIGVLGKYRQVLKEYDVSHIMVIATTAVREARNRNIFIDTVSRKTGFNIEVLNAGDVVYYIDAYLTYKLKNTYPLHAKRALIAELGSGSLDVSLMEKGLTLVNAGLPLGTLRISQLMSGLDGSLAENYEAVEEAIENEIAYLKKMFPKSQIDDIILIDENYARYVAHILKEEKKDSNKFFPITLKTVEELLVCLRDKNSEQIAYEYKIPSEVAETITAYMIILHTLFSFVKEEKINILETSLAEAILANVVLGFELAQKYNKTNQLISAAHFLCRKYDADLNHAKCAANLASTMFGQLQEHFGLKEEEGLYLILAAYLHDIGMFIHNRSHHKHTEYIINCLNLFRLTEIEIKIIAAIARYHRKATPRDTHPLYMSLPVDKQILVQKLSAILRIANALDRAHKQKVKKLEVTLSRTHDVTLTVYTEQNFTLEKADFLVKKDFFEEITGNKIKLVLKTETPGQ